MVQDRQTNNDQVPVGAGSTGELVGGTCRDSFEFDGSDRAVLEPLVPTRSRSDSDDGNFVAQYVWTLFTGPLNQKLGTTLAELQWTFSLLIILQTWCSPLQTYLVDRFGPRLLISVSALMSGGGWVLSSYVNDIWGCTSHTASSAALGPASSTSES